MGQPLLLADPLRQERFIHHQGMVFGDRFVSNQRLRITEHSPPQSVVPDIPVVLQGDLMKFLINFIAQARWTQAAPLPLQVIGRHPQAELKGLIRSVCGLQIQRGKVTGSP